MIKKDPIGNRVREIRLRLGIQQQQLAQEVGVSRQTIIAIEKGRLENPTIRVCLKIARILREPVDYVFYLDRHVFPKKIDMTLASETLHLDAPDLPEGTVPPATAASAAIPVLSEGERELDPLHDKAELSSRVSLEQALPAFLRNLRTSHTEQPVDSSEMPDVTYPSQGNGHEPGDETDASM